MDLILSDFEPINSCCLHCKHPEHKWYFPLFELWWYLVWAKPIDDITPQLCSSANPVSQKTPLPSYTIQVFSVGSLSSLPPPTVFLAGRCQQEATPGSPSIMRPKHVDNSKGTWKPGLRPTPTSAAPFTALDLMKSVRNTLFHFLLINVSHQTVLSSFHSGHKCLGRHLTCWQ